MKNIKYLISIIFIISFFFYTGCKKKNITPDPIAIRLTELMNGGATWNLLSVSKDSYDVSSQFSGFTLTIGEHTYTTTNSISSAWASTGTWEFYNRNIDIVKRDDGTLIDVTINGNQLTLSFSVTGLSGGRLESINGDYVFVLTNQ